MADPIGKTGCVGWWLETAAADGTTTTSWADSSGLGNTVANASSVVTNQTGELFGLPVQRFTGAANSWLRKTSATLTGLTANWTCGFVIKPAGAGSAPADTIISFGDVTGGGPEITLNGTVLQVYPAAGALACTSTASFSNGTVYRVMVTCSAGTCAIYVNGTAGTTSVTARTFDYTTSPVVLMGAITATPTEMWNGDLAEVVLYNSVATAPELTSLDTYLTRWTSAPPAVTLPILVMAQP